MNNKEAIRRKKLYYDSLEKAIARPIPAALAKELDAIINDSENDEVYQKVLRLWKVLLLIK